MEDIHITKTGNARRSILVDQDVRLRYGGISLVTRVQDGWTAHRVETSVDDPKIVHAVQHLCYTCQLHRGHQAVDRQGMR